MPILRTKTAQPKPWLLFTVSAIVLVLFLFYIDEGHYSLKGFTNPVHLLIFFIYLTPSILAQFLVYRLLNKMQLKSGALLYSVVCGLFIGVSLVMSLFYVLK